MRRETTGYPAQPPRCRRGMGLPAMLASCALLTLAPAPAQAQASGAAGAGTPTATATAGGSASRRQQAAIKRVGAAAGVAHAMGQDPGMVEVLGHALGIYIVPSFGRAALGVGASGGAGLLLLKRADGSWGNPAFFNIGGLSLGLQAGAEGGAVALVLMNPKAVDSFRKKNNFSLSAEAGLTVVNYARAARASTSSDIVVWSGNKGLFGNLATVAVNDVRYNPRLTEAYYGKSMTAAQAIDSTAPDPQADALRQALGGAAAPASSSAQ